MPDYNQSIKGISADLLSNQGKAIRVAVMDTGSYAAHPDFYPSFNENIFDVLDSVDAKKDPNGHGTHISGLIGARSTNDKGVRGVAPACELIVVKVIGNDGNVLAGDLAKGLRLILDQNVQLVNLSLSVSARQMEKLKPFLDVLLEKGIHIIAAAGNNADLLEGGTLFSPADYANIITVGAVSKEYYRSNPQVKYNSRLDLIVEEIDLLSCSNVAANLYKNEKGCSQSTAIVTGIASLLLSAKQKMSKEELRNSLLQLSFAMETLTDAQQLCLLKPR